MKIDLIFQIRYHSMQLLVITLFLGAKPEQNPDSPHLTPSKPSSSSSFWKSKSFKAQCRHEPWRDRCSDKKITGGKNSADSDVTSKCFDFMAPERHFRTSTEMSVVNKEEMGRGRNQSVCKKLENFDYTFFSSRTILNKHFQVHVIQSGQWEPKVLLQEPPSNWVSPSAAQCPSCVPAICHVMGPLFQLIWHVFAACRPGS